MVALYVMRKKGCTGMKFRTVGRHFKEGTRNVWRNGWMTVASVGAVTTTLLLVGLFLVLMLNLNQVVENVEDDVEVKVLIDLTAKEEDVDALQKKIKGISTVDTVEFSSKENELEELVKSMGDNGEAWELFEQDNPLNDAFVVKAIDPIDTFEIADKIKMFKSVSEVTYGKEVIEKLFVFNKYTRYIGLGLVGGLLFTAVFLISNTIKITIIARKKEIGIMKFVGATNSFIRWPYFIEGLSLGVLGSIIPIGVISGGYYFLYDNFKSKITMPFVELLPYNPFAWQLSLVLLGMGACIGMWGSVMSVRKFLKV